MIKAPTTIIQTGKPNILRKAILFTGLGVTSYFAIKGIIKLLQGNPNKDEIKATEQELDVLNQSASTKQTLSSSQVLAMANKLFQTMDGYGTDENQIVTTWGFLKNNADYLAVVKAFGTREISSGSWNPEANFIGTLPSALANELDYSYLALLNKMMQNRGITYRL
jgi:hypothetical protein